jgi:hypothetical protein
MPRVNLWKEEIPFVKVRRLLLSYEMNGPKMGNALGKSAKTGKAKLDHPETLTLGELWKISKKVGIPVDELREAITR